MRGLWCCVEIMLLLVCRKFTFLWSVLVQHWDPENWIFSYNNKTVSDTKSVFSCLRPSKIYRKNHTFIISISQLIIVTTIINEEDLNPSTTRKQSVNEEYWCSWKVESPQNWMRQVKDCHVRPWHQIPSEWLHFHKQNILSYVNVFDQDVKHTSRQWKHI